MLNGNTPHNEYRYLIQACRFLGMNTTSTDSERSKRARKKGYLLVHPSRLNEPNHAAVARAMSAYSCQVINAAHDAAQSGHDIPAKEGCMADANNIPITAQGIAK